SGFPMAPSTAPTPQRVRAGSIPTTRTYPTLLERSFVDMLAPSPDSAAPRSCVEVTHTRIVRPGARFRSADLGQDLVGDVGVGVDVLDVVGVFEGLHHADDLLGRIDVERDLHARQPAGFGGVVVDPRFLQGSTHIDQVGGLTDDLEDLAEVRDLFCACVQHSQGDVVLGGALLGDQDHALTVEQVGHRTGITHAATVTGDGHAHLGSSPVAVVGQTLHEYGDPAGGVTLVHDGLPIGATRFLTGTTLAGTFDAVQRDRTLLRLLDRVVERRVPLGVPTPETSGHLHVLDQLGEELAALGVDDGFLVFGGSPLGVARHACP